MISGFPIQNKHALHIQDVRYKCVLLGSLTYNYYSANYNCNFSTIYKYVIRHLVFVKFKVLLIFPFSFLQWRKNMLYSILKSTKSIMFSSPNSILMHSGQACATGWSILAGAIGWLILCQETSKILSVWGPNVFGLDKFCQPSESRVIVVSVVLNISFMVQVFSKLREHRFPSEFELRQVIASKLPEPAFGRNLDSIWS